MHDRGQALPLVVAVLAVVAVLVAALGVVAGHSIDAARARTAADAAALAGVEAGEAAAEALAHANGGVLVEFRTTEGGDVVVRVRVETASASAHATLDRVSASPLRPARSLAVEASTLTPCPPRKDRTTLSARRVALPLPGGRLDRTK